jgi:PhoD-like phosphatase, N-terminal domain
MKILFLAATLLVPLTWAHSFPHLDILDAEDEKQFLRAASGRRRLAELDDPIPARNLAQDSLPLLADFFGGTPGFYHGVASGDPLPSAIILWTRYTPTSNAPVDLELRIAEVDADLATDAHLDPSQNPNLKRLAITVNGSSDWVAKIDLTDLKAGTKYVFAFTDGERSSDVGLTQTAPATAAEVASMTYAFFSCSHYSNGYFHPYDVASTIKDLDMWIHVGDYVVSCIDKSFFSSQKPYSLNVFVQPYYCSMSTGSMEPMPLPYLSAELRLCLNGSKFRYKTTVFVWLNTIKATKASAIFVAVHL